MQPGDPIGDSCPPIDPRDISRREFLKASSCVAATVALGTLPQTATAQAGGEVTSANLQFTVNGVDYINGDSTLLEFKEQIVAEEETDA